MNSMTGYSIFKRETSEYSYAIEIKSLNHKYLDLKFNIPYFFGEIEKDLRNIIKNYIKRGKLEINIRFISLNSFQEITINHKLAMAFKSKLEELKKILKIKEKIHLGHIMHFEGIVNINNSFNSGEYKDSLLSDFEDTLKKLVEERKREGESIYNFFIQTRSKLYEKLNFIENNESRETKYYFDYVKEKMKKLIKDLNLDEKLIVEEAALYAARYDITEEIKRIHEHLTYFYSIIESKESIGKKLDFICQELMREVNTICSKSIITDIKKAAIEMKDYIEKIREQARNVE